MLEFPTLYWLHRLEKCNHQYKVPAATYRRVVRSVIGGFMVLKNDLSSVYHQIAIAEEDIRKIPSGHVFGTMSSWWCLRLTNTHASFKKFMHDVVYDHFNKCVIVLNHTTLIVLTHTTLINSRSIEEQVENLRIMLETLERNNFWPSRVIALFDWGLDF